ncbi:hypothetical protein N2152v2_004450 [Parachlorella kessleri]
MADTQRLDQKDEVQALFSGALFLRCDALEVRSPVVILQHEKANCYHVLEKHFRQECLPAQERFWRNVKTMYSPALETWRPRVNGVQLKVLQGARLPETEEEWDALDAALSTLGPYLRADSSVGRLSSELRDFVGLLDVWWANRKRGEGGPGSKRPMGASLALPMAKRQSMEFVHATSGPGGQVFVQPEIISHSILATPRLGQAPFMRSHSLADLGGSGILALPLGHAAAAAAVAATERQAPGQQMVLARQGGEQVVPGSPPLGAGLRLLPGHASQPQLMDLLSVEPVIGEQPSPRAAQQGAAQRAQQQAQHGRVQRAAQAQAQAGARPPQEDEEEESCPLLPGGGGGRLPSYIGQSLNTRDIEAALRAGGGMSEFFATTETGAGDDEAEQQSPQQLPQLNTEAAVGPQHSPRQQQEHSPRQQHRQVQPQRGLGPPTFGSMHSLDDVPSLPAEQAQQQPARPPQSPRSPALAAPAPQSPTWRASDDLNKVFVSLNVGGHRFLSTAATLAAVEGSFLWQLAQQSCSGKEARRGSRQAPEFFIDRSGKLFEYVLDYLRCERFGERESSLPRDERTLGLLRREAGFYQLPRLAERAASALAALPPPGSCRAAGAGGGGCEGACPAGQLQREGSVCDRELGSGSLGTAAAGVASAAPPVVLDAVFLETGMQPAAGVGRAQAALLQKLNTLARQAEGYAIVKQECGAEREGSMRNLFYHVVLRKQMS